MWWEEAQKIPWKAFKTLCKSSSGQTFASATWHDIEDSAGLKEGRARECEQRF